MSALFSGNTPDFCRHFCSVSALSLNLIAPSGTQFETLCFEESKLHLFASLVGRGCEHRRSCVCGMYRLLGAGKRGAGATSSAVQRSSARGAGCGAGLPESKAQRVVDMGGLTLWWYCLKLRLEYSESHLPRRFCVIDFRHKDLLPLALLCQ